MKKCEYCDRNVDSSAVSCPNCGGQDFKHICDNCGHVISEGLFCPRCGVKVGQKARICPRCGNKYYTNACPDCGFTQTDVSAIRQSADHYPVPERQQQIADQTSPGMKDKAVALILCFFLGYLGLHKFYEGKAGMGIIYLVTFGLFGIGWIIDFIVLLFKPSRYVP